MSTLTLGIVVIIYMFILAWRDISDTNKRKMLAIICWGDGK